MSPLQSELELGQVGVPIPCQMNLILNQVSYWYRNQKRSVCCCCCWQREQLRVLVLGVCDEGEIMFVHVVRMEGGVEEEK